MGSSGGSFRPMSRILRTALLAILPVLAGNAVAITPNIEELAMAQLAVNHPGQQRPEMVYDPILHMVARAKALDLAGRASISTMWTRMATDRTRR